MNLLLLFYAVCRGFWITQTRRMFWALRAVRRRSLVRTNKRALIFSLHSMRGRKIVDDERLTINYFYKQQI
jgi:hypothetical protein